MLRRIAGAVLVAAVLSASVFISYTWLTNKPRAMRRPPAQRAPLVEVIKVYRGPQEVVIRAMGTVMPARKVSLVSQVSGRVVEVSPDFTPGGRLKAGQMILRIDPRDYEIALKQAEMQLKRLTAELAMAESVLRQREADVVRAKSELDLEMGRQAVAKREYELLGKKLGPKDRALVLRQPQLQSVKAAYEAAKAAMNAARSAVRASQAKVAAAREALQKAALDLQRTIIRAPFNCIVDSKEVDIGSYVSTGKILGSAAGTDEFWVVLSVATSELMWIKVPGFNSKEGSVVRLFYRSAWGEGAFREGEVARLLPSVEPKGRMARVLVSVRDPLDLMRSPPVRHPLLMNSYVSAEIQGKRIFNAVKLPRRCIRHGSRVWVMRQDGTLEIRPVTIAWEGRDEVLVSRGLSEGELVVVSDLASPVQGMRLRRADSQRPAAKPKG